MEKHFLARNPMFFRVIFFIFLLAVPLQRASAQITFSVKGGKLGTVIEQIKKQSGYQFFYSDNLSSEEVNSVNVTDASVENIMDKLFDGRNISYRVVGKIIYLSRRPVRQSGEGPLRKISGRVTDEKNEPLAGVSVVIKGTQTGVYTDQNGYYVISTTKDDPVMEFVYMGYKTVSVRNNKKTVINVYMQDNAEELNEVVVTALGIKRSQKALSYNVQQIKDNEITGNTDANFVNSLSGKVAGVVINSSSSGIGGASKVVMRGAKAIAQSSNALYVIDGVPMFNFSYDGGTEYDSRGTSEGIADINPEDIESISVLTGAAAAALYGSEAANGA
ncbi:MAG: TonB-dependent receptor plug domain-containing protein, partial [Bacteroidales bacterium]|nr:TonB-dependent receptor plug domain-containing protein [Bacteroidales bacterium]